MAMSSNVKYIMTAIGVVVRSGISQGSLSPVRIESSELPINLHSDIFCTSGGETRAKKSYEMRCSGWISNHQSQIRRLHRLTKTITDPAII